LNCCEVKLEVLFYPEALWTRKVIRSDMDDTLEKMAHLALTEMWE
jgi:(2Fe-2S) ferredoxin